MSGTSKRPRAPLAAPGEVVTNWKIVRIVVGLAVLAGGFIGLGAWSAQPHDGKALPSAVVNREDAFKGVPRVKMHELRRELVVYGHRESVVVEQIEVPPNRRPGPVIAIAPDPEGARPTIAEATEPAPSRESATKRHPSALLPTLDERTLLRQLGFDQSLNAKLDELSAAAEGPLDAASAYRVPKVVDVDLDTEKGTILKLHKILQEVSPSGQARRGSRVGTAAATRDQSLTGAARPDDKSHAWAQAGAPADAWLELIAKRADLQGLPYRKGDSCQLKSEPAFILGAISRELGSPLASGRQQAVGSYFADELVGAAVGIVKRARLRSVEDPERDFDQLNADDIVPALLQMMQARPLGERKALVSALASIPGRNATGALALRALFELSKETREMAIEALNERPADQLRPYLLAGLRYPWAPIADHAAVALVAVDDREAAKDLVRLLDEPDPTAPFINTAGKWAVRELTRVNHLRGCFLCHAPSLDRSDAVRGMVPVPGQPLPRQYSAESRGNFVRADVTYLKQDFSLLHPVEKPDRWPDVQRFDYLVRTRELTSREVDKVQLPSSEAARRRVPPDEQVYPQRESVLYALRMLTNQDAGRSAAQWRKLVKTSAK